MMGTDTWIVKTKKCPDDPELIMRYGNIYQLSNGYMGYRGTLDEFRAEQLVGITLAGIYDQVGNAWREPVNAPNGGYTSLVVDGIEISALSSDTVSHEQSVHLKNAVFERKTIFSINEKILDVGSKRWLSVDNPNLMCIEYGLSINKQAKIELQTGIDYKIWDINGPHLELFETKLNNGCLTVSASTHESGKRIAVAEYSDFSFGKETHYMHDDLNLRIIEFDAEADKVYTLRKYVSVVTDSDPLDQSITEHAESIVRAANKMGYEKCLSRHEDEWNDRWNKADVIIEGDDEAQLALRYSIFQLLMVSPVKESGNSIPARALSGQVYKGAIFWDTEMFMLPFFLHTIPDKAIELLRYRIRTLDGARRKAQAEGPGYRGAFYAWESQETGDDACSYFNVGDPITNRPLRTHFRDKQIHISGDVAIALWKYFEITGDDTLLREGGTEVILECARFYYSYIYFKKDKNRYEVLDVIGPDEYHERVNNNAFTNLIVKATFEIACKAAHYLEHYYINEYAELIGKLNIEMEIPLFREAAGLTYLPVPDNNSGVIEQFDGYFKLKEETLDNLKKQLIHPNEYWGAAQGIAVPTKVIKQADVVMMLSLFGEQFSREIKKANWEYYESRTEHGSSLSANAYAIVASQIGKPEWAYKYFMKTATIDLHGEFKLYAGTIFIGGSHPAANGGAWMTAIFGFAGVNTSKEKISIDPRLYQKWNSMNFKLVHRSALYSIQIDHYQVKVDAHKENKTSGKFDISGIDRTCNPGSSFSVNVKNFRKNESDKNNQ